MDRLIFTFLILAAFFVLLGVIWPDFWTPRELPYQDDDPTRGNWSKIPSQGHSDDLA